MKLPGHSRPGGRPEPLPPRRQFKQRVCAGQVRRGPPCTEHTRGVGGGGAGADVAVGIEGLQFNIGGAYDFVVYKPEQQDGGKWLTKASVTKSAKAGGGFKNKWARVELGVKDGTSRSLTRLFDTAKEARDCSRELKKAEAKLAAKEARLHDRIGSVSVSRGGAGGTFSHAQQQMQARAGVGGAAAGAPMIQAGSGAETGE